MGWLLSSLLLSTSAAYVLVGWFDREPRREASAIFFRLCLAICLGIGISSCGYFLWMFFFGASGTWHRVCELALFAAMSASGGYRMFFGKQRTVLSQRSEKPKNDDRMGLLPLIFCAAVGLAVLGAIGVYRQAPNGDWDAWAIWNLRAKCLFRANDQWQQAFSVVFEHIDYPLLISCANARLWSYYGQECSWGPWLLGSLFTLAMVGLLTAGVWRLRSRSQGLLAGITLLGIVPALHCGAMQYADVPLAFYILASILLLALYDASERPQNGLLVLSGLAAGLAAWTKNEGVLFLLVLPVARCVALWHRGCTKKIFRDLFYFGVGAAPVLGALAIQKMCLAATNDVVARQSWNALLMRLSDPSRYAYISKKLVLNALDMAKPLAVVLPVCFLLLGFAPTGSRCLRGRSTACLALILMLLGYFMVYVVTPQDLEWHITTSSRRLLMHLCPSCLLILFLSLSTLEESPAGSRMISSANAMRRVKLYGIFYLFRE
jgi:hypothetical protein